MCWNFTTKPRYTINSEYHIHCISTEPPPIVLVHSYTATVMGKKIKILSSQLHYIFFTYKQRHFVYFVCYEVLR